MASTALVPKDLWADSESPLRTVDVLSQIAHFLEQLGYSKTVAALIKEASKQDVIVDAAEWTRAIDEKTGTTLLELYELWLKKKKSLPTIPAAKETTSEDSSSDSSSESESENESESDESMQNAAEGGALVDIEAEETSDDSSDEENSSSSSSDSQDEEVAAPVADKKRKRVMTPPSSSSESDGESSADEAPITKKAKTKASKAASVSSSSASDSSSDSSSASSSSSSESDSSSSASSGSSSSEDSSSSESEAPAPPPKKAKKEKKIKTEEVPEVVAVAITEVKPKKEKKSKKSEPKPEEAPSTTSSATLAAEESEEPAAENVQESSIHPSRLAQVPVADLPAATRRQIAAEGKAAIVPFSRIPADQYVDPKFASNAYVSYDYADRAHRDLVVTKGKGFTKEKNKKKRGTSIAFCAKQELRVFNGLAASALMTAFPDVEKPEGKKWWCVKPPDDEEELARKAEAWKGRVKKERAAAKRERRISPPPFTMPGDDWPDWEPRSPRHEQSDASPFRQAASR